MGRSFCLVLCVGHLGHRGSYRRQTLLLLFVCLFVVAAVGFGLFRLDRVRAYYFRFSASLSRTTRKPSVANQSLQFFYFLFFSFFRSLSFWQENYLFLLLLLLSGSRQLDSTTTIWVAPSSPRWILPPCSSPVSSRSIRSASSYCCIYSCFLYLCCCYCCGCCLFFLSLFWTMMYAIESIPRPPIQ